MPDDKTGIHIHPSKAIFIALTISQGKHPGICSPCDDSYDTDQAAVSQTDLYAPDGVQSQIFT